jgi:microcystin-dependent protein
MPIGLDAAQAEFDAMAKTGGAKTVTLDVTMMPSHTHTQDPHTHIQNAHSHGMAEGQTDGAGTFMDRSNAASATTATTDAATAVNQNATAVNQSTGGGSAHPNLPPYVTGQYIIKT